MSFVSRNHPQQVGKRGALSSVDDRATPPELFDPLNERFKFTLDVAASMLNAKCERYISIEENGLEQSWHGERVWCNPPYSDIRPWVEKAWREWPGEESGHELGANLIVMLLPANRTEQGWWQDLVEPLRDDGGGEFRVEFLRGRQRFIAPGADGIGPNERPPFGCCLLIWGER